MYEFSSKEIRSKFKKTEYGKRINKMLYISIIVALVLFIVSCITFFITYDSHQILISMQEILLNILFAITVIAFIIACYFYGKRDAAVEQFKRANKK